MRANYDRPVLVTYSKVLHVQKIRAFNVSEYKTMYIATRFIGAHSFIFYLRKNFYF